MLCFSPRLDYAIQLGCAARVLLCDVLDTQAGSAAAWTWRRPPH
jgi:hypothetical protein